MKNILIFIVLLSILNCVVLPYKQIGIEDTRLNLLGIYRYTHNNIMVIFHIMSNDICERECLNRDGKTVIHKGKYEVTNSKIKFYFNYIWDGKKYIKIDTEEVYYFHFSNDKYPILYYNGGERWWIFIREYFLDI